MADTVVQLLGDLLVAKSPFPQLDGFVDVETNPRSSTMHASVLCSLDASFDAFLDEASFKLGYGS